MLLHDPPLDLAADLGQEARTQEVGHVAQRTAQCEALPVHHRHAGRCLALIDQQVVEPVVHVNDAEDPWQELEGRTLRVRHPFDDPHLILGEARSVPLEKGRQLCAVEGAPNLDHHLAGLAEPRAAT